MHRAYDAGGHPRQHRLGEPPTFVDLAVGVHQFTALGGELAGHPVERARQAGELVAGRRLRDPHREIAAAHAFRGEDQPPDRTSDLVGQHQTDRHRREQHQQRHDGKDPGEGELQPRTILVEALVFGHRLLGPRHVIEDRRIHRPADHQHQRWRRIEPHHGLNARPVAAVAPRRRRPAPAR